MAYKMFQLFCIVQILSVSLAAPLNKEQSDLKGKVFNPEAMAGGMPGMGQGMPGMGQGMPGMVGGVPGYPYMTGTYPGGYSGGYLGGYPPMYQMPMYGMPPYGMMPGGVGNGYIPSSIQFMQQRDLLASRNAPTQS